MKIVCSIKEWWNDKQIICNGCYKNRRRGDCIKRKRIIGKPEMICNGCIKEEEEYQKKVEVSMAFTLRGQDDELRRKAEKARTHCFECGIELRHTNFYCPNCYDKLMDKMYKAKRAYRVLNDRVRVVKGLERRR